MAAGAVGAQIAPARRAGNVRRLEAAMPLASEIILIRFIAAAPAAVRAGCVALLVCVSGCGGGGSGEAPSTSMPSPDVPQLPSAPARLVVGTAQSIDTGASGDPVSLRVARSANGDGIAVWKAANGVIDSSGYSHHDLWANRYRAATAGWDRPIRIVAGSTQIEAFDLAVDASGNAVVAWNAITDPVNFDRGVVMSARFDRGAGGWSAPVPLSTNARFPRVASDAAGTVLAAYVVGISCCPLVSRVRGRFFDPATGEWQPEAAVEQNNTGVGESGRIPAAVMDGSGNALVAFEHTPSQATSQGIVASNYYSPSTGGWGQLPPSNVSDVLGRVPGPYGGGIIFNLQLATTGDGNFVLGWDERHAFDNDTAIYIARFSRRSQAWSPAQLIVPSLPRQCCLTFYVNLHRIGSDASGNALVLWTEGLTEGGVTRTALKAIRLNPDGAVCVPAGVAEVIDSALGGGAWAVDLSVEPLGDAIAIWQQFEGGRALDNSRTSIAINHFDVATGTWEGAVLAETQPGDAISPSASAGGGQALLGWIQAEGGVNRIKVLLQPLNDTTGQ